MPLSSCFWSPGMHFPCVTGRKPAVTQPCTVLVTGPAKASVLSGLLRQELHPPPYISHVRGHLNLLELTRGKPSSPGSPGSSPSLRVTGEPRGLVLCLRFQSCLNRCLLSPLVPPSCTTPTMWGQFTPSERAAGTEQCRAGGCAERDLGRREEGIPVRMPLGLRREGVGIGWKVTEISGEKRAP